MLLTVYKRHCTSSITRVTAPPPAIEAAADERPLPLAPSADQTP
jgi:hypothetical protein